MTDPTKKDESAQASDKAKAVKSAMTGTPDAGAIPPPMGKPADPVKEPPKPDAAASTPVNPPEAAKTAAKEPPKGSVPPSTIAGAKPGATAGGKEPPKGVGGGQTPGGPKGPGATPMGASAKPPQPKRPAAAPKKKRGCLGTLIWLVVIVAALGAGAYFTWPYWPDMVKKPVEAKIAEVVPRVQMPEEKAALDDRLAKHEQQLSTLEGKVAELASREADDAKALAESDGGNGSSGAKISALTARMDALEKALSSVGAAETSGKDGDAASSAGATAAIGISVQALSQRVAQLETEVAQAANLENRLTSMEKRAEAGPSIETKAATVLAVSHLSNAVMQSVPYADELASLKAVAGDDATLAEPISVLEQQASTGVPSLVDLRASFPAVAREISRVHADWTGEDWVDKALSRVTSLVSVRKTGTEAMADQGTDGAIAKAEAALELGDVAAAATALNGLEGPAAEAAAPWLAEAQKRLDAMSALAALRQGAISLLAKGD